MDICVRSSPSDSLISSSPPKKRTTSAFFASSTATFVSFWFGFLLRIYPCSYATTSRSVDPITSRIASGCFAEFTSDDPAPWYLGTFAKSPITATFVPGFNGRIWSSFFRRTILSSAAFLAKLWCASTSNVFPFASSVAWCVEKITFKSSSSLWSNTASSRSPFSTAWIISYIPDFPVPGISKWLPFFTPSAWSLLPPQSDTTKPSKPHSSTRISCSMWLFSFA